MCTHIQGIENIKAAVPCIEEGVLSIETVGTNVGALNNLSFEYPCIKTVTSNDPFDVLNTFGIEAARKTLFDQIHMVLSFDGSYVNVRHYQVLVDWMTHKGHITATTRHGIGKYEDMSPIARATFEQPVEICLNAAYDRKKDPLSGISEQLLMGASPKIGTEMIEVRQTQEYKNIVSKSNESDSDDDDENWISFESAFKNPFETKEKKPPMLHPPKNTGRKDNTPLWSRPSVKQPWSKTTWQPTWSEPSWNQAPKPSWSQPVQAPTMSWNQPVQAPAMSWNQASPKNVLEPTSTSPKNVLEPTSTSPKNVLEPTSAGPNNALESSTAFSM